MKTSPSRRVRHDSPFSARTLLLGLFFLAAPVCAQTTELPLDIREALQKLKSDELMKQVDGAIFLMNHGTLGASGIPDILPKLGLNYDNGKDGGFLWFYEVEYPQSYFDYRDPQDVFVRYLVAVGEPAVEPLLQALRGDYGEESRQYAAEALGRIGDERALEPLTELEPQVTGSFYARLQVARRILEGEREDVVQGGLLSSDDADVQEYAARRLRSIIEDTRSDELPERLKGTDIAKQIVTARVSGSAQENLNETIRRLGDLREVLVADALREQGIEVFDRWEVGHIPTADLISLLKHPNVEVRLRAAELLGKEKRTTASLDALAAAFEDSELRVRKAALRAMPRQLYHERAIASVQSLLTDLSQPDDVRMEAAVILARSGQPTDWSLVIHAQYLLDQSLFATRAFVPEFAEQTEPLLVQEFSEVPKKHWGKLAFLLWRTAGESSVDFILERYKECDGDERSSFWVLFRISDDPRLKEVIVEEFLRGNRTMEILHGVGETDDPRVIEPLLGFVANPQDFLLSHAAWALVKLDEPRAIEPILRSMLKIWDRYYYDVLKPLVELSRNHIEVLAPLLRDPDSKVRRTAMEVLERSETPLAAAMLLESFSDRESEPRRTAAIRLAGMRKRTLEPFIARALLQADPELTPLMLDHLYWLKVGGEIETAITALLGSRDDNIVRCAADRAGKSKLTGTTPVLLRLAATRENVIRAAALAALARMQDHSGTAMLIEELDHPDFERRRQAVINLGLMGDPEATRDLLFRFRTPDHPFVYEFVDAFGLIGDELAVPALIDYAAGEQGGPLQQVFRALGQIGGARAAKFLAQYADSEDPDTRAAAVCALGKTGEDSGRSIVIKAVSDPNSKVRFRAVDGLVGFNDPETLEVLLNVLTGEENALYGIASTSLRDRAGPELVPTMLEYLKTGIAPASQVKTVLWGATHVDLPAQYEPWAKWWEENKEKYDLPATQVRNRP